MLQIVKGPAKSGKTEYLLTKARELCGGGRMCTVVVSQQVSFEYERLILKRFSPAERRYISVKSFEALSRDILKLYGGTAVERLSESAKRAAVRRAVDSLGDSLMFFRRHRRSEIFYDLACRTIDELSLSGITPDQLLALSDSLPDASDRAKLGETAYIFAAYQSIISGRYLDDQGAVESAARTAKRQFFADTVFFLDEFDSFTYPQKLMIDRMLDCSAGVYCALPLSDRASDLFYTPARTERQLLSRAEKLGAYCPPAVELALPHSSAGIAELGSYLLYGLCPKSTEGVYFCRPRNIYAEVRAAAAAICALVRGGRSYSDIAVLVSSAEKYKQAIKTEFSRYGIPYFSDYDEGIIATPAVRAAAALLASAEEKKPVSELLLTILKTGICALPAEDVMLLSNYVFVWSIEGDDWHRPFTQNPCGFKADFSAADRAQLERIEAAREFIITVYDDFCDSAVGDGDTIISALYRALTKLGCDTTIKELCAASDPASARRAAREYELFINILDNMHTLLLGDSVSPADIAALIKTESAAARLYDIPETICQVTVGEASRARPFTRPVVFAFGLIAGDLPSDAAEGGLFTERDRELIISHGAPLQTDFESGFYSERLRVYRALTTPSELLFMSAPESDLHGAALAISDMLADYISECSPAPFPLPETAPLAAGIESARSLLPLYSPAERQGLQMALEELGAGAYQGGEPLFSITDDAALAEYLGNDLILSPSRAECFSRCAFRYFMRYIMVAEPIKAAKLDYREMGNLLHYLLEKIMRASGGGFTALSVDDIQRLTAQSADEYITSLTGGRFSQRLEYLKGRLTDQAARLLINIQSEQLRTRFVASDYELSIKRGGDIPARELMLPDGGTVRIEGKVDRVDVMTEDGRSYIRVVDYKTGAKKFSLPEVYYGLSVQMFIYLFSICENGGGRYPNPAPAGVMFMRSEPNMQASSPDKAYMMDGIIINDSAVIDGIKDEQGIFVPAVLDKSGELKACEALTSAEKLGRMGERIDRLLVDIGSEIRRGHFEPDPLVVGDVDPCASCDYHAVCRFSDETPKREADLKCPESKFELGGDDYVG